MAKTKLKIKINKKVLTNVLKAVKNFFKKKVVKISLIAVLVLVVLFLARSLFFAAWVDGRPIFRLSLERELEKQGGKQVLDSLIDQSLIEQEAKKNKVTVTQSEVDTDLKSVEDMISGQGMTLDQALQLRNETKADLISQIKTQKLIEKLLSSKITISDQELQDYFNQNKSLFGTNPVFTNVKDQVQSQLFQQKLSDLYTTWIADLRSKAKIIYFLNL